LILSILPKSSGQQLGLFHEFLKLLDEIVKSSFSEFLLIVIKLPIAIVMVHNKKSILLQELFHKYGILWLIFQCVIYIINMSLFNINIKLNLDILHDVSRGKGPRVDHYLIFNNGQQHSRIGASIDHIFPRFLSLRYQQLIVTLLLLILLPHHNLRRTLPVILLGPMYGLLCLSCLEIGQFEVCMDLGTGCWNYLPLCIFRTNFYYWNIWWWCLLLKATRIRDPRFRFYAYYCSILFTIKSAFNLNPCLIIRARIYAYHGISSS